MALSLKKEILIIGVVAVALSSVQGCSSLFGPHAATPDSTGFRGAASTLSNPVPLPVEIVNDISMIAAGHQAHDGAWRPVYPEVDKIANAPQGAAPGAVQTEGAGVAGVPLSERVPEELPAREISSDLPTTDAAEVPVEVDSKTRKSSGKNQRYVVRNGDTLMKISFEKYGNIYRWREIYNSNKSRIPDFNRLSAGTVLTIQGVEYIMIRKNGVPYLIRRNDTLGKISNNVYGTPTEWRSIWKNNPQLIRNPNKIYTGFTLYYVPKPGQTKPEPVRQISGEKTAAVKLPEKSAPAIADTPATVFSEEPRVVAPITIDPIATPGARAAASEPTAVVSPTPGTPMEAMPAPEEGSWVPSER